MNNLLIRSWYKKNLLSILLLPFSIIYRLIISIRRSCYKLGIKKTTHFSVPIIIVGNITVGGTGKTPLVIYLANWLKQQGYRPGIVSRGYGGWSATYPLAVTAQTDPKVAGDEAVLIARHTQCPLYVAPKRVGAVKKLLQENNCNIILSDDGLQHYALGRSIEIAVMDGERRLGNGLCLPAGPLREPAKRLTEVDFIVCNGMPQPNEFAMRLLQQNFYQINSKSTQTIEYFKNKKIQAVAGIGNPTRFFNMLRQLGLQIIEHSFPDHHIYTKADLNFGDNAIIVMTEKDAVKCEAFAENDWWYLPVQAELTESFLQLFKARLNKN